MRQNKFFFWQPRFDFLKYLESSNPGKVILVIFNYFIWFFLFYISFLLVDKSANIFWQILFATIISEVVERVLKSKIYWKRPMFVRHDLTPAGLVDKWYQTGSFPSGHTIKAVYFYFFCLQYQVFNPEIYILIVAPLLVFRILMGFHYPIDIIGGALLGWIIWLINSWYLFPLWLTQPIDWLFNVVFYLGYGS